MTTLRRWLHAARRLPATAFRCPSAGGESRIAAFARRRALRFRSPAWRGATIGVICAMVCWGLAQTSLIRALENWAFDDCFALRGRRASAAKVVVVAVDEASLQEIHKPLMFLSPELAKVVDYLHDQGAAAIGVDLLLPESEETLAYVQPNGPGDAEAMGKAVGRAGNVVLPEWLLVGDRPLRPCFEWSVPSSRPWVDLGFVDLSVDSDSCLRRQALRMWDDRGGVHASMALALLAKARRLPKEWLEARNLSLDGVDIPLDAADSLTINYVGPAGSIEPVSLREVLAAAGRAGRPPTSQSMPPSPYRDAIVLIGMVGGEFKDRYPTPYTSQSVLQWISSRSEMMSGLEFNANVIATLIDRAFITTPWWLSTPLLLVMVGGVMGAILARCGLEAGALLTLGHHIAWRGLVAGAFYFGDWRVETVPMLLMGVLLYGTIFAMRWRWIRRMMGMVKSEAVARALESGSIALDLRGEHRNITVLFCDVRDFTPFSEGHSPHEVVRLLNALFAAAVPPIEAEGGIVNQYIGDALMAIFGAPQAQPDHAVRAVRAALEIVGRVHGLRDRWKELDAEGFRIGIGVHTGGAVVGTVGSPDRLDYTAIGDTVNTAARIESANRELRTELLISQATFAALPEDQRHRISAMSDLRSLSVKGKKEPLVVCAVRTCDSAGT